MPDMQKLLQTKEKILQVIRERGPELPVRVASAIGNNNIFTAAFMSELVGEQKLKLSNMRVGGSPLYYISGQEEQLQKYSNYLNHKEKEAFNLLKQNNILEDSQVEPAIRVALRHIKDFATPIQIIDKGQEKLFWKIHTLPNEKAKELIEDIISPTIKKQEKPIIQEQIIEQKQEIKEQIQDKTTQSKESEKPLSLKEEIITKKEKTPKIKEINSQFLEDIKKVLTKKEYEITKEIAVKKKEFTGKVKINTSLGAQEFYLVAKDKKKITLDDLVSTLQKAQAEKMPALILSPGDIDKKAIDYFKEWNNLIKHQKINF